MTNIEKPHFLIKRRSQKGSYLYSDILTSKTLKDVCKQVTGCTEYSIEYDDEGYNKGRLALLEYRGITTYVSFSETGEIAARNSFFQSLTTALIRYYQDKKKDKRICFYFLPLEGSIETDYFKFIYRLMATAGVDFLNSPPTVNLDIHPFSTVDDIIAARYINKKRNKSNNSTYITKNSQGITEIYGKTYGASKKETSLLCIATSRISLTKIDLYEICEKNLSELPAPDLAVIKSLENVNIIQTDLTMERNKLLNNDNLRSPIFTYNLLQKLGRKKCSFCKCEIAELIEGAHLWPVAEIKKRNNLTDEIKFQYAVDGDNGVWLCENHHKMLDVSLLKIDEDGKLEYKTNIDETAIDFVKSSTLITQIKKEIITEKFKEYLKERNKDRLYAHYQVLQ